MNSEEVDWCWRMRAAGWQVWYLHTTDVRHVGGASGSRRSARQYQRLIGGKLRFIRKRYGRVAAAVVSISHRISQLTRAAAWWIWAVAKPSTYARERARVCWQVASAGRWT